MKQSSECSRTVSGPLLTVRSFYYRVLTVSANTFFRYFRVPITIKPCLMKYILALVFIFSGYIVAAQEMAYRFGYLFKQEKLVSKGKLYEVGESKQKVVDTVGYVSSNSNILILKEREKEDKSFAARTINTRLKGTVKKRSGDSLYIKFWDIVRSEEHTSELQSRRDLVCRLLLEKKK